MLSWLYMWGLELSLEEKMNHSVLTKLWFYSVIFPMTLGKGIARHWKFSYLDKEESCFSQVLHTSRLLRVFCHLAALKSYR